MEKRGVTDTMQHFVAALSFLSFWLTSDSRGHCFAVRTLFSFSFKLETELGKRPFGVFKLPFHRAFCTDGDGAGLSLNRSSLIFACYSSLN